MSFNVDTSQWQMTYANNGGFLKEDDRDKILINKFALKSNIEQSEWVQLRLNSDKAYNLFITPAETAKAC